MGQGTCAFCEGRLTDHDGSIVYLANTKEELIAYNEKYLKEENPEIDSIIFGNEELNEHHIWLCQNCKTANVWSDKPKKYRAYKLLKEDDKKLNIDKTLKMKEIFILHCLDDS